MTFDVLPPTLFAERSPGGHILIAKPGEVGTYHEQLRRSVLPRPRGISKVLAMEILIQRIQQLEQAVGRQKAPR